MAINPTNSNTVNIINLPKAQIAVGSDLLVLQTTNGTQTITFDNFNVVKTDVSGNATVTGKISGNYAYFSNMAVNTLTAASFNTAAGAGVTLPNGFYNQFTIQNGIILSAVENVFNDPVYVQLYNNDIPQFIQGQLKNAGVTPIIERSGSVLIPAGLTSYNITVDQFFASPPNSYIAANSITPAHINLATDFVPTTAAAAINLTALQSLTALVALSGVNSGFLAAIGGAGALTSLMSSLTSAAAISLLTGNNSINIPNSVTPIVIPTSITSGPSSDGTNTALNFTISIGVPQAVPVTVYWKLDIVAPLQQTI